MHTKYGKIIREPDQLIELLEKKKKKRDMGDYYTKGRNAGLNMAIKTIKDFIDEI